MEMEEEKYRNQLKDQIRVAFGKVVYSQTCHHKMAERLLCHNNCWKIAQIIFSAILSCSAIAVFF